MNVEVTHKSQSVRVIDYRHDHELRVIIVEVADGLMIKAADFTHNEDGNILLDTMIKPNECPECKYGYTFGKSFNTNIDCDGCENREACAEACLHVVDPDPNNEDEEHKCNGFCHKCSDPCHEMFKCPAGHTPGVDYRSWDACRTCAVRELCDVYSNQLEERGYFDKGTVGGYWDGVTENPHREDF